MNSGDDTWWNCDGFFRNRIPGQSDLCCYWFEKARELIAEGKCQRAGLLATQGIRGGANREVFKRIKQSGNIFFAVSDQDWFLDGANVHVSMVGFDNGGEAERWLNGKIVDDINANLSTAADMTKSRRLPANENWSFLGKAARAAILMFQKPKPSNLLTLAETRTETQQRRRDPWSRTAKICCNVRRCG